MIAVNMTAINIVVQWLVFLVSIKKVLCSILGLEAGYPDRFFTSSSHLLLREVTSSNLSQDTDCYDRSFMVFPQSLQANAGTVL
jgi:hypothetical protein